MTEITHTMNFHTEQFTQQKHALCVSYWYCTDMKVATQNVLL